NFASGAGISGNLYQSAYPDQYEVALQKIPLGKFGETENDIGRVAVFLASEDSNYITGQTIMVDGGAIQLR
ncbi:MAG: SDR family oxidoreductase, partial [Bacillus sp. (in: firmicutes)]